MPGYSHIPVMVAEVLAALQPKSGGRYIDGTLGSGGHAAAILEMSAPAGWLYGCDRDGEAIKATRERLAKYENRLALRHSTFAELDQWIEPGSCDGALLDLGVSSFQLDQPGRGFGIQNDGPLDMRMDQRQSLTAAQVINSLSVQELARIFREFGNEPDANRVARAIDRERQHRPLETTRQLALILERAKPFKGVRRHPATKVFLALRLWVNDEIGLLKQGLRAAWNCLRPGGRLAVITFHSYEDRFVKDFGRKGAQDYDVIGNVDIPELRVARAPDLKLMTRKALKPTAEEVLANPRARSAQLRVFERIHGSKP